ncbi:MAG: hypothetical protein VX278_05680 [Myxococcota bacterium]|nr:hypothetical protein [Myxococcota bacterium]
MLIFLSFFGCTANQNIQNEPSSVAPESEINFTPCPEFQTEVDAGIVSSPDITEASGMDASWLDDNILWVHNDSGDSSRLFAINLQGAHQSTITLEGIIAIDWEDMAIGPGPLEDIPYIYVGDFGDNDLERNDAAIYRFPEPSLVDEDTIIPASDIEKFPISYPEGPQDAEALVVHPLNAQIWIITKSTEHTRIYTKNTPLVADETNTLTQSGSLPLRDLGGEGSPLITAAALSPNAVDLIVRTYTSVYILPEEGLNDSSLWNENTICQQPAAPEAQGETIAFSQDGSAYFTLSEGSQQSLYRYDTQP